MGRFRGGYSSYRGRRTITDILKWIAIVLGVLVVLLVGVLVFGQDYLVFTDNGLQWRTPLASGEQKEQTQEQQDVNVVIQPPAGSQDTQEEPPAGSQTSQEMKAQELPVSAVVDGTAQGLLEQAGANALILEMKDSQGQLGWSSQLPLAVQDGVTSSQAGVNEALQTWNQGEIYTIAKVCCFRDNTMPYQHNSMALRANYGNWRDEQKLRWMNPDSQEAVDYLAGLCGELAQLGFDELVLECPAFPTQGNLEAIQTDGSYASGAFATAVEHFLAQVEQAVEPYGTVLSLQVTRDQVEQQGAVSGLTGAVLEQYAQRVWVEEDGEEPTVSQLLESGEDASAQLQIVQLQTNDQGTWNALGLLPGT